MAPREPDGDRTVPTVAAISLPRESPPTLWRALRRARGWLGAVERQLRPAQALMAGDLLAEARREVEQLMHVVDSVSRRHYGALPLPPAALRLHVGMSPSSANFLWQGINSSERVLEIFGDAPSGPVLDWGCGSGRTLRWLWSYPKWREHYVGCDVDEEAIAWLREAGVASVSRCDDDPPLPYADRSFEGVFAFSVLTHIHPLRYRAWYEELRRVSRPRATVYLTFHGRHVIESPRFRIPRRAKRQFSSLGYAYVSSEEDHKDAAFVTEEYVREIADGLFEIEDFRPTGYQNQDATLLRALP